MLEYLLILVIIIEAVCMMPWLFSFGEAGRLVGLVVAYLFLFFQGQTILASFFLLFHREKSKKYWKTILITAQFTLGVLCLISGVHRDLLVGPLYHGVIGVLVGVKWKGTDEKI